MKNKPIGVYESADIKAYVGKIIRGLGNPAPPVELADVRELLRLDRKFYSTADEGALHEFISKVRIAGKQIVARPTILLDVVRKANLSALWLPDRKRILIDEDSPPLKHRWLEAHEIGHSLIPWHSNYLLGDDKNSLDPVCYEQLEAEANFAAGQLLFMQQHFTQQASDLTLSVNSVRSLAEVFRNTLTSTLWRFVEEASRGIPVVGVVCPHPHFLPDDFNQGAPCKYCIESPEFRRRFSRITELELFRIICSYCKPRKGGPVGRAELSLLDDNGAAHLFTFESFYNSYDVLTLAVYKHPAGILVAAS